MKIDGEHHQRPFFVPPPAWPDRQQSPAQPNPNKPDPADRRHKLEVLQ